MKLKSDKGKQILSTPQDLKKALSVNPKAKQAWEDITPIARRDWIISIVTAKQKETRKKRINKAISMLSSGKRRICCFPGINWMLREQKKSGKVDKQLSDIAKKLKLS